MTQARRVLALMPHPDDIEILCAGTLLRLRERGCEVHCCTMTAGDKGSATLSRDEISAIRRAEAKAAAMLLGASSCACLGFQDLEIVFDNESRRRVAAHVRRVNPGLIITTPPVDYMADHEVTSQLVRDAAFNAAVPNYDTGDASPPSACVPHLYYSDPVGGVDLFGSPAPRGRLVDISAQIVAKSEVLACHASQREWLRQQHGMDDYIDSMRRWCAVRGATIGVAYAENMRQHVGHPYPGSDLLAEWLGDTGQQGD